MVRKSIQSICLYFPGNDEKNKVEPFWAFCTIKSEYCGNNWDNSKELLDVIKMKNVILVDQDLDQLVTYNTCLLL